MKNLGGKIMNRNKAIETALNILDRELNNLEESENTDIEKMDQIKYAMTIFAETRE